jgi:uncharacterized membrane protein YgdD (TMEM256/DUF423 family)
LKPNWIAVGALSGALAVALGAFGAHGLKDRVSAADLEIWKTGVLYQAIHAVALVLFGLFRDGLGRDGRGRDGFRTKGRGWSSAPGWAFLSGSLVFSGTLYALALGGPRVLGAITPLGGLALIVGWLAFAVLAVRRREPSEGSGEN